MPVVKPVAISDYYLWLGVPDLSQSMLKSFDPAYTGHVHIFVTKLPEILTKWYPQEARNLKAAIERASTSFTGLPEIMVNYQDQQHGFADRRVPHVVNTEMNFDQASIRLLEFKGLPVYNALREWMENISDPISKIKDYKGRANQIPGGYSLQNHTMSMIVITTDPSNRQIQGRAHYITAAAPVSLTQEHFNWNSGEIDIVQGYDIGFRGVLRWGSTIDAKAKELLDQRMTIVNFLADQMHSGGNLNGQTLRAQTSVM